MDLEQNELPICPAARVCEESLHFERDASPALAGRPAVVLFLSFWLWLLCSLLSADERKALRGRKVKYRERKSGKTGKGRFR